MLATVLKPPGAADAQALIPIQPLLDCIGITRLQQLMTGDRMRRLTISYFQQGRTAFTYIGPRVMIAVLL